MTACNSWEKSTCIYDTYSTSRRRTLLALVAAVYPLLPLSDTILLTQLPTIAHELGASNAAITAAMSLYLLAAGAGFALWGPVADLLGRLVVYHAALAAFLVSSVGCALAPSIALFLVGRTVQGLAASGTWAVGNAVVADIYPIEIRGMAYGVFMMPGMLGPVIAPFIGAALTQAWGWRSMMWFLVILSAAAQLAVLIIYRETQQHRVAKRIQHALQQQQQCTVPDWVLQFDSSAQSGRLQAQQLLQLLKQLLSDPPVLLIVLLLIHAFGCMFLLLLQLTEILAAAAGMSAMRIGLCYLATGCCSMGGSLLGGWVADKSAAAAKATSSARLEWGWIGSLLIPAGLLLVGWTEPVGWKGSAAAAAVLVGGSLASFGASFVSPGGYSYLSHRGQEFAAAIGSLTAAGANIWPAALLQLNPLARPTIGTGVYNTVVAAVAAGLALACCAVCLQQRRHASRDSDNNTDEQHCDEEAVQS